MGLIGRRADEEQKLWFVVVVVVEERSSSRARADAAGLSIDALTCC
jgi:hypothetical protein